MDTNSPRVRNISTGSESASSSDESNNAPRYDLMNFDDMMRITNNMDTDVFENTRKFNPRKHRSCHRRPEPVSEDKRKQESSKNSREYTKRNRDEIKVCQALYEDIEAKRVRLRKLVDDMRTDAIEPKIKGAVQFFEDIIKKYTSMGDNARKVCNVPDPDEIFSEYLKQAELADSLTFETGIESYEKNLQELRAQFAVLSSKKEALNSQKDKTNYASSKSRLKQRIVRAQLKTHCWKGWNAIETMRLQGKHLKKCVNRLRREIWTKVLGVYNQVLRFVKTETISNDEMRIVDAIVESFVPFSRISGTLSISWIPEKEIKKEDDKSQQVAVPQKEAIPASSPQRSPSPEAIVKAEKSPEEPITVSPDEPITKSPEEPITKKITIPSVQVRPTTLSLPTVPASSLPTSPGRSYLDTPTGLSPASAKTLYSPVPAVNTDTNETRSTLATKHIIPMINYHLPKTIVEDCIDERQETTRKRNWSDSLDQQPEEKRYKHSEEEEVVPVSKTGPEMTAIANRNLVVPISMNHALMMNQHLLPQPIMIQPFVTAPASVRTDTASYMPVFNQLLSPVTMSQELLEAFEHQKQIQKLLSECFSKIPKQ